MIKKPQKFGFASPQNAADALVEFIPATEAYDPVAEHALSYAGDNFDDLLQIFHAPPAHPASNPAQKYSGDFFASHVTAQDIQEVFFLFALGAQMTANKCKATMAEPYPQLKLGNAPINYKAVAIFYDFAANVITITPEYIIQYVCAKHADKSDNAEFRKEFLPLQKTLASELIKLGAEETYHCYQFRNAEIGGHLGRALIEKYGPKPLDKRGPLLREARNKGKEATAEFFRNDPIEKDADDFLQSIKHELAAVSQKFTKQYQSSEIS